MAGLLDLGGGVKMADPENFIPAAPPNPITQATQVLTLDSLLTKRRMAPMEEKKLEIETALKANDLLNLEVENILKRAQLASTIGDENRKQSAAVFDTYKKIAELFQVDPALGAAAIQSINPNARTIPNNDGTATIEIPKSVAGVPSSEKITVTINPSRLTPEKKKQVEGDWYDRFSRNRSVQAFTEISRQKANIDSAASLATAQGDIAIVFSFMKMNDPQSTVREGEQATARNAPGVPDRVRNLYNRALTSDAPIFGPAGSQTRTNFVDAAKLFYQNSRNDTLRVGQDISEFAQREGLDPKNVLYPVGDIGENEFLGISPTKLSDDALKAEYSKLKGGK